MSTPPEKPQSHGPLHNFSLPQLKWYKSHSSNLHRGRRVGESSSQQQSQSVNAAVLRFQESLSLQPDAAPRLSFNAGSSSQRQKPSAPESATKVLLQPHSDSTVERPKMDSPASERKDESERSELNPGFRQPMADEDEEEEQKTWNFRPRRPLRKARSGNPGTSKVDGATTLQDDKSALPPTPKSSSGVKASPKIPKKPMFSLSLTPEEIEEDIFVMTGARPSRKPKRRPKAVQKHLDNIFPGMWLGSVTPDAYKVPDPSKKK